MSIVIRSEIPADAPEISRLITQAFLGNPHSEGTEAAIVDALRSAGALVLPLVALRDGEIVGYSTFSPVRLSTGESGWFGLGPVAVAPDAQRQGIGTRLIEDDLLQLIAADAAGCVVVGEPNFYRRFGFAPVAHLRVNGIPPEYILARAFAGPEPDAVLIYHPAFGLPDPNA
ncbi:GNAT family N-acetyltransferase [Hyphomicrobium methylovorum]|uniref:GNAT family N-acetyltransferase n=1 Tax=Hyphomicrobium methylovorum TaxID=84 RepID=UPI0015E7554E|nr:N-acetyltransferase [Hyphomicrobium methylovorum]MBA2127767.1 GNAT family N-acetyltransferase [Hyphomicrobium methylovorum]